MPEQYDEIRSMIKSKRTCNYSRHPGEEQNRFEKLIKANFDEEKSDKSDEKEEKSSENSKSESESPKSESKPPKNDSEEAQDDFPAPDQPDSGSSDGEIDYSELGEILAAIEDALGEEVAQEICDIVMEHLDDDEFEAVMEAKEEADPAPETGGMEPFDGGATVIMGVEGDDEPEDEGYVSIRECINLRKSGNRYASYNKELTAFKKVGPTAGVPEGYDPAKDPLKQWENHTPQQKPAGGDAVSTDQAMANAQKWTSRMQSTMDQRAKAREQEQAAMANAKQNADKKAEPEPTEAKPAAAEQPTENKPAEPAPEPKPAAAQPAAAQPAAAQPAAAQPAAGPARVGGGGNNYYSLLGPRLNGQPGLLSRLMQAIRNWRLNRARVNQAGQAAAPQAPQAAQANPAPPQNQGA